MWSIKNWWKDRKTKCVIDESKYVYQICEKNGKIWLTYDNCLVCPIDMFEEKNPVEVLGSLRLLYTCSHNK